LENCKRLMKLCREADELAHSMRIEREQLKTQIHKAKTTVRKRGLTQEMNEVESSIRDAVRLRRVRP
jgi:hypothetical protein